MFGGLLSPASPFCLYTDLSLTSPHATCHPGLSTLPPGRLSNMLTLQNSFHSYLNSAQQHVCIRYFKRCLSGLPPLCPAPYPKHTPPGAWACL